MSGYASFGRIGRGDLSGSGGSWIAEWIAAVANVWHVIALSTPSQWSMELLLAYIRRAEALIYRLIRLGRISEIERQLRRLAMQMGIDPIAIVATTIQEAIVRARVRQIVAPAALIQAAEDRIQALITSVDSELITLVRRLDRRGYREQRIRERIAREFDLARHHATTLSTTLQLALSRATLVERTQRDHVQRYTYVGPRLGARAFCQALLDQAAGGKTWTITEIERMDNGQGLPVLYFCGGYNCRHHWMPVR